MRNPNQRNALSEREKQIFQLLTNGKLNKEIAHDLNISTDTVKKHLKSIYLKLGVRNRVEAVLHSKDKGVR